MVRFGLRFILSISLLTACEAKGPAPTLIFRNGKIFTADSARFFVQAIAIRDSTVMATGSSDSIGRLAGKGTIVVDLGLKTVVPGFNDAHDHVTAELPATRVTISGAELPDPTWAELADSLRATVTRAPAGGWIYAEIGERVLSDPAARRSALDRLAPHNPVRLQAWTGHGMIVNSAALKAVGVGDTIADPLGGRFERDRAGRLTGLIEEYAEWTVWRRMPVTDSAHSAAFLARATDGIKLGITTIQNMMTAADAPTTARLLPRLSLPSRLRIIRFPLTTRNGTAVAEWRALTRPARSPITVGGTKWILDGTPVERLAMLRLPYADRPGWRGRLDFPPDTVRAMLAEILAARDQPILHAVGDSSIGLALATMAALAPDSTWRLLRPRIEHGEGLTPDLFPLARRLGVTVVQNPTHLALQPIAAARLGPERLRVLQPLRSLLSNRIQLALGSDGPQSPFLNLMLAVIHPDNPPEAITMIEAVTAYTAGSAAAEFAEGWKGRLVPGMVADLAVLSADIFTLQPEQLPATTSVLTLVGGRPVWDPGRMVR
jgi:predicted amidohydrolase YtcJ